MCLTPALRLTSLEWCQIQTEQHEGKNNFFDNFLH